MHRLAWSGRGKLSAFLEAELDQVMELDVPFPIPFSFKVFTLPAKQLTVGFGHVAEHSNVAGNRVSGAPFMPRLPQDYIRNGHLPVPVQTTLDPVPM